MTNYMQTEILSLIYCILSGISPCATLSRSSIRQSMKYILKIVHSMTWVTKITGSLILQTSIW